MKLLVISNMWPGPRKPYFGTFVETRVRGYREAGADVTVAANRDPRPGALRGVLKYMRLLVRSAWKALRTRPDVIEGHYLVPTALITAVVARMIGRPYVLYAHGSDVSPPRSMVWLVGRALACATEIQTNSEHTRLRLEARFPGRSAVVTPIGVELSRFPVSNAQRDPIVAYVGNLDPVKGPDVLLQALGLMRGTQWRCRVAGSGPLQTELLHVADALDIGDRIDWLGAVEPDQVGAIYREARVSVIPSRRDAFGSAAVEALASGTPVVVSAVGGLQSIPTAECGSVVAPDDPLALAAAIGLWLDSSPGPAVVGAARKRAQVYDARRLSSEAVARLRSIVGAGSADE